jgi:hypothetical protein
VITINLGIFVPSATSFSVLSSYSFIGHYMLWPNWPSSGVQVVMVKDSSAHCNAVFFPPTEVASGYFGYVGYHQFYFGILQLHVAAFPYYVMHYVTAF